MILGYRPVMDRTVYKVAAVAIFLAYLTAAFFLLQVCLAGIVLIGAGIFNASGSLHAQLRAVLLVVSGTVFLSSPFFALLGAKYSIRAFAQADIRSLFQAATIGSVGSALYLFAMYYSLWIGRL
ncbi:hypothetical protein [Sphingomonas sp. PAMC 26621]|uniref:hypothetical protein n=1 Tax=Sphingomonas sp. PAMC 26621 TaxID=1112213 RepID=UPI000474A4D4|nr:hypothetical protein [Sphingomonas sp. PAMC 26621]